MNKKKTLKYIKEITLTIESEEYLNFEDLATGLIEGRFDVVDYFQPTNNNNNGVISLKEKK